MLQNYNFKANEADIKFFEMNISHMYKMHTILNSTSNCLILN